MPQPQLLTTIKNVLDQARKQVVQTVNLTMVKTYFQIGKMIVEDLQQMKNFFVTYQKQQTVSAKSPDFNL